ncbi:MAG: hypothetical protein U1C71_03665, partial [archaeon]|nr:hypothetical protein [archaeon]
NNSPPIDPNNLNLGGYCIQPFVSMLGGSNCTCAGDTLFLTGITSNPSPIIHPPGQNYTLTLLGSGIEPGDTLRIAKENAPSTVVNLTISSSITATLTTSNITTLGVGNHSARVIQGPDMSNSITLPIVSASSFVLSTVTPNAYVTSQNYNSIAISGYLFQSGDRVEFQGACGTSLCFVSKIGLFVSNVALTTSLTTSDLSTLGLGIGSVRLKRGANTYSNSLSFSVSDPNVPTITEPLDPDTIGYNAISPWITVTGTNFGNSPTVKIGNPPNQVTILSSSSQMQNVTGTSLEFQLNKANTLTLGATDHPVTVTAGIYTSLPVDLTISPPIIDAIIPDTIPANQAATLSFTCRYPGNNPKIHVGSNVFNYPGQPAPLCFDVSLTAVQVTNLGVGTHDVRMENTGVFSAPFPLNIGDTGGASSPYFPPWSTLEPINGIAFSGSTGTELLSAINNLSPGQKLIVPGGTYQMPNPARITAQGTASQPIFVVAAAGANPVLTASGAGNDVLAIGQTGSGITAAYLALRGFEITGGNKGIIFNKASNIWLDQLRIHDTANAGIHGGQFSGINNSYLFITRNEIHNVGEGAGIIKGTAVMFGTMGGPQIVTNAVIALNHIHHTGKQAAGIQLNRGSHSNWVAENHVHHAAYNYYGDSAGYWPCMWFDLSHAGTYFSNQRNIIEKNVIHDCSDNGVQFENGRHVFRNNLVTARIGNKAIDGTHNTAS